ncbi:Uncharacterised protein [Klebsiella pneumoniae]|nr:Uncharacterised protein [Klebsiella pneumoniae]SXB25042.1 Uncharacterised protein [Klebsiella pneumoniae]
MSPLCARRQRPPQPNGRSVSDRVSEEASYLRNLHFLPYAPRLHFPCHMKHFHNVLLRCNILSQYTLR